VKEMKMMMKKERKKGMGAFCQVLVRFLGSGCGVVHERQWKNHNRCG
jgi:Tfp pilus assembly ATPase PilU